MIQLYGMQICPDCAEAREQLLAAGVDFAFLDFADATQNLKDFLKIREGNPLFDAAREAGGIGIPCFVLPDGSVSLELKDALRAGGEAAKGHETL